MSTATESRRLKRLWHPLLGRLESHRWRRRRNGQLQFDHTDKLGGELTATIRPQPNGDFILAVEYILGIEWACDTVVFHCNFRREIDAFRFLCDWYDREAHWQRIANAAHDVPAGDQVESAALV